MSDFLHIDLPCSDADIKYLEKVLEIKFKEVLPETIPSEQVKICPMSPPSNRLMFLNYKNET